MVDIEVETIENIAILHCLTEKGLYIHDVFKKKHNNVFAEDSEKLFNFAINNKAVTDILKKDNTIVFSESNLKSFLQLLSQLGVSYKILK